MTSKTNYVSYTYCKSLDTYKVQRKYFIRQNKCSYSVYTAGVGNRLPVGQILPTEQK